MSNSKQSGFAHLVLPIIIAVVVVVAGTGVYMYHRDHKTKPMAVITSSRTSKRSGQPSTSSNSAKTGASNSGITLDSNSVTDYYAPANISFAHDKSWTWDISGESYGYAEHPDEKSAKLNLTYPEPNGQPPEFYTVDFMTDSVPPSTNTGTNSIKLLGQVDLDGKTLYIVEFIDTTNSDWQLNWIETSGCPNAECSFTLPNSSTYFYVQGTKHVQNGVPLDSSKIPELVSIFESMRLGK